MLGFSRNYRSLTDEEPLHQLQRLSRTDRSVDSARLGKKQGDGAHALDSTREHRATAAYLVGWVSLRTCASTFGHNRGSVVSSPLVGPWNARESLSTRIWLAAGSAMVRHRHRQTRRPVPATGSR